MFLQPCFHVAGLRKLSRAGGSLPERGRLGPPARPRLRWAKKVGFSAGQDPISFSFMSIATVIMILLLLWLLRPPRLPAAGQRTREKASRCCAERAIGCVRETLTTSAAFAFDCGENPEAWESWSPGKKDALGILRSATLVFRQRS